MKAVQFKGILKRVFLAISLPAFTIIATPLVCGLTLLLLATDILRHLTPRKRAIDHQACKPSTDKASIVILNWNGREFLGKSVPSVIEAVKWEGGDHEIIVVDNGSTDDSVAFLRSKYPQIRVIVLGRNYYFSGGCNEGVRRSRNDIVVLLNNDMIVDKNFLRPLLDGFVDDDVFAVSAQIFFWDKDKERVETGKTRGFYRWGFLQVIHDEVKKEEICPILYAGGGSAAFDKHKFMALGGFDDLFDPFYWEDTDLSYRAWKRGWRVLYEPQSVVHHKHRGTIGKAYDERLIHQAIICNHFLFMWKNFTDPGLLLLHVPMLVGRLAWNYLNGSFAYLAAFTSAVGQIGAVLQRRAAERRFTKLTDKEVLAISSDLFQYKERFVPRSPPMIKGGKKNILFICPYIPCLGVHAGAGRMYTMIKLLSRRHRVSVITFMDSEEEAKYIPKLKKHSSHIVALYRHSALGPRKRNPLQIEPPVLDEFYSPQLEKAIYDLLGKEDFDIVQAEYTQMSQYVPTLRQAATLLTEHEVAFLSHYRSFRMLPFSWEKIRALIGWLLMLNFEIRACQKFDRVITLTETDKKELLAFNPALSVSVIPTGVDGSYFRPQEDTIEPHSLVFVGYYKHLPNVDGIMRFCRGILPRIKAEIPDVKLYIVGSSPTKKILALAEQEEVVVSGWVEDIRPYIAKSAVYVVPVWLGTGIRGKILEAWGMAKPVVTTKIGSQGLDCRHEENVLIADSPEDFAAQVVRLLRDEELRNVLGQNGRRQVETKYDWQIVIEHVERVYDEALSYKSAGGGP